MHGRWGLAATDKGDDLDAVAIGNDPRGMFPPRDDRPIDLDRVGARIRQGARDERGDGGACGDGLPSAIELDGDWRRFGHGFDATRNRPGVHFAPMRFHRPILLLAAATVAMLGGCSDPTYDTSTPASLLDAIQKAVQDGRPEDLPQFIEIQARDIAFDDGVTEASAISDVKGKLSDMLGQLGRVSRKLKTRFEKDLAKTKTQAERISDRFGFGPAVERIVTDPFKVLDESRSKLEAEDLGDGTAALTYEGDPVFGGFVALVETGDGWRVTVPLELVQSNEYWPQTRHEWAVVASLLLGVENSLTIFEGELDQGKFRTLDQASERAGRLLGESVVIQSVIYASMKGKGASKSGGRSTPSTAGS